MLRDLREFVAMDNNTADVTLKAQQLIHTLEAMANNNGPL
jgi:hypothetical protein